MTQCLSEAEIQGFVRGGLNEQQHAAAESHVRDCAACAARVGEIRETSAADRPLRKAATQVEVTSAMEVKNNSPGNESHWTDNSLPIDAVDVGTGSGSGTSVSLDEFLTGLSQSGILGPADVASVREKSQKDPAAGTVPALIEWLVQEHKLTRYQAEILARGNKGGLVLGNYVILEKLGQGGMGTVFKARHRRMNRLVALKVLPQSLSSIPEAILRFQREVEAAAKLQHTNIAAAFDADEESGVHFLVMEYVDGPNLSSYIKQRGPLPLATAVRLMMHAASGLATAHAQGIVHRDIKPANLMITKQGVLKVLDMGLAQMRGQDANLDLTSDVTQTGRVMGTVDYMAPEQARDAKNVDLRADIYSLGCTLYFLATGKTPAPGGSAAEKLLWHQTGEAPVLSSVVPASTPRLDGVLARMMAKRTDERYGSMPEVVTDLEACLADLPAADERELLDGMDLVAEHTSPTMGGSRYGQVTMAGGLGDTVRAVPGAPSMVPLALPAPRSSRTMAYSIGIAGALVLAALAAVPFLRPWGAVPGNGGSALPVSGERVAANTLPNPAKTPSPHAPYEKLLNFVFANHGQITTNRGSGEQAYFTSQAALPSQPLDIIGIKLDGTGVRDADLTVLALAPGLRELSLADTKVTDQGLEHLTPLKKLSHLNLSKTGVTNSGLAQLARLGDLTELNLERTQITNPGLARLLALSKLERLYLSDTQVSDVGIDQLQGLKSLRQLTLHGTSLSDGQHTALKQAIPELNIAWDGSDVERGVALKLLDRGATIAVVDRTGQRHDGVKNIESLPPGRVSVKDVNLKTGASFGDDDLKQLAVLSEVESIGLAGSKVTANGLAHLHGLTTLKSVDLGTLRLAPTAIESLLRALPNCQVNVREPADVEVAQAVLATGGSVSVFTEQNRMLRDLKEQSQLPTGHYSLRAINLDDVAGIDDAALAKIGELPVLESLFLTNTGVTDAGLANIAACKSLYELSLSGTKITPAGLASVVPLPKLSRLYVAKTALGREGVRQIGELAKLTHLSLLGVKLDDGDLAPLKRLDKLEWLDVSDTGLTDAALTQLNQFTKLRELIVAGTKLSDAGREELVAALGPGCRVVHDPLDAQRLAARWLVDRAATVSLDSGKLTSSKSLPRGPVHVLTVDLADLSKLGREEIKEQLAGCHELVALNLSNTRLVESDLALVQNMPSLRELRLANLEVTDKMLERLAGHSGLEVLDLSGTFVTGQGLKHLSAAAGLKQLLLANARVSDIHFAALAQFPQLEVLDVSATAGVSDAGVDAITKLPALRVVRLRGSRITDSGLEKLAALKELEELDVEGAKVTDAAVARLAPLAKLRVIGLGNTQVTDGVTGTLGQMKQLRQINLSRTKISAESIRQLQAELKNCSITAPAIAPRDAANAGGNFGNPGVGPRGP